MNNYLMKVLITALCVFTVPTIVSAASFNCAKAASKNEKAICSDAELSNLDEVLAASYKQARKSVVDSNKLKSEQINWIKSLGTCDGNVPCLITAYKSRLSILGLVNGSAIVLADPLQDRIAELNEREEILIQRENALTTEMRALNSAIEAFEAEKLAFAKQKTDADTVAKANSTIQKPKNVANCHSGITPNGEKISLSKCVGFTNYVNKAFNQPLTYTTDDEFNFAWENDKKCEYLSELGSQEEHIGVGKVSAMSGIQTQNVQGMTVFMESCNALYDHHLSELETSSNLNVKEDSPNATTTNANSQCFNYSGLSEPESFVASFSAASCAGYFAATQEASNPQMFAQLRDMGANVADAYEEVSCSERKIFIGLDGSANDKFERGYETALANATMVKNGAMSPNEFKMRVNMCSQVVGHYLKQMQTLNK